MATAKKAPNKKTTETVVQKTIVIQRPNRARLKVRIRGLTPLILSALSVAVLIDILKNMQKDPEIRGKTKRPPKDPVACYNKCFYEMPPPCKPGHALLALAIKKAMVSACREVEGISMTEARQFFHVYGTEHPMMIRLHGEPRMRNDGHGDAVRNENGKIDIRFRPEWPEWHVDIVIRYNADLLTAESVLNLLARAGEVGIGEWRSDKSGNTFGQFEVVGAEGVA